MKIVAATSRWGMIALTGAVMAIGIIALAHSPAQAKPGPGPECGPTRQWICEVKGCPDCYVVLFEGTICEKTQFEKKSGRVCTPA